MLTLKNPDFFRPDIEKSEKYENTEKHFNMFKEKLNDKILSLVKSEDIKNYNELTKNLETVVAIIKEKYPEGYNHNAYYQEITSKLHPENNYQDDLTTYENPVNFIFGQTEIKFDFNKTEMLKLFTDKINN